MKVLNLILSLLCFAMTVTAEPVGQKVKLQGTVTDAVDGSPLTGVVISIPSLNKNAVSDSNGKYIFNDLTPCKALVQVSYLGHQTQTKMVDLTKVSNLDFVMKEANAMINEVVVTGISGNTLSKNSPMPVAVLSAEQLQLTSSTNIIDALSKVPGVSQVTTGGGISKPVIRGLGYNRVVVVNDGVRQEGQQWGDEHGIEIDPQTVGSVEVLKGPASLMYGSDAMAGVVIFNRDPFMPEGKMMAQVGSEYQTNNGLFDYTVDFSGNQKGFVWNGRYSDKMAHAYKDKYDGYVLNSQFRERAASAVMGYNGPKSSTLLTLSYYHLTPGIVEGDRDETTGQFLMPYNNNGQEDERIATDHERKTYGRGMPYQQIHHYKAVLDNTIFLGSGQLKTLIGYQQNRRQEFENPVTPNTCGLYLLLHTVNYDFHYQSPVFNGWSMATGINGMYQKSVNKGSEYLIPAYRLFDYGVFAMADKDLGDFHFSGGLRYDQRHLHSDALTDDGKQRFTSFKHDYHGVTGSLGATWNATRQLNVRLNLSRGFRVPTISELASNGVHDGTVRYELGQKGLKPENSWQVDLGSDYTSDIVSAQVSLFVNRINHYVFSRKLTDADGKPVITDGFDTYQFAAGNACLSGGELNIDIHPVEALHFENDFSYVNSIQLHQPKESKYLPFTPAPRWNSSLHYDFIRDGRVFNNLFAGIDMECDFKQTHFYAEGGTETETPSYTLFNLSAGTEIRNKGKKLASIVFSANNIFDRGYQSHLSRLKYEDVNNYTGRTGVFNMGRNFGVKVLVPIAL
jgi:iron complex outermembrane receptor protein